MLVSKCSWLSLSLVAAAALTSGLSFAADELAAADDVPAPAASVEPAPSTATTTMDLSVPKPQPPVARQYRQHEGGYVRADVGLGTFGASGDAAGFDLSTGGATLTFDLLVGYGPAPGLTLGGGVAGDLQLSGDWEVNGVTGGSGDLGSLLIGPFVDGFPDSTGGWHMGGMAGLARTTLDAGNSNDGVSALGFGAAAWAGHGVWVAPEWSIAGLLRVDASRTSNSDDDVTLSKIGVSLMFSVLYN